MQFPGEDKAAGPGWVILHSQGGVVLLLADRRSSGLIVLQFNPSFSNFSSPDCCYFTPQQKFTRKKKKKNEVGILWGQLARVTNPSLWKEI